MSQNLGLLSMILAASKGVLGAELGTELGPQYFRRIQRKEVSHERE